MAGRFFIAILIIAVLTSFAFKASFKGAWEYSGGIYNGKAQAAATDYKLQREYDKQAYKALFIEKDAQPFIYEKGNYSIKQDTCFETQTFSSEPSKLLNITLKYTWQIKNDTLTFNGTLPNGTVVTEYWKKVK